MLNIIAQFSAMTTCSIQVHNAHGCTQNTNGAGHPSDPRDPNTAVFDNKI